MYKKQFQSIEKTVNNDGIWKQQTADYNLNGVIRSHDNVPYNVGNDLPEQGISVKSSRFTLCTGLKAQDFNGMIAEYMANTVAKMVLYVSADDVGYFMSLKEFESFMKLFCRAEKNNKGEMVVRCNKETKFMIRYLDGICAKS